MKIKHFILFISFCILLICNGCSSDKDIDIKGLNNLADIENSTENLTETSSEEITSAETSSEETSSEITTLTALQQSELNGNIENSNNDELNKYLSSMTLEEKVAQLFVVLPESLITDAGTVVNAGDSTKRAINEIPIGGFIYLGSNLNSSEQVKSMLANTQTYSIERIGLPAFLCIDEEGGAVARISGSGKFNVPTFENMSVVGASQNTDRAYKIGSDIGAYLSSLGFNVDFAPVADVLSNPENNVVKDRSFGSTPSVVSSMSMAVANGLKANGVFAAYKHFPGHGATAGDTHEGYAYTKKSLNELKECELIPFQSGIEQGIPFIMVGHISLPTVTGDNTPASLSKYMISDLLRSQMGYNGIIITDAMNMGAVVQQYSASSAAVKALQAGVDIILMPSDFRSAYNGVIAAVKSGTISQERIDESLKRIINVKLQIKKNLNS